MLWLFIAAMLFGGVLIAISLFGPGDDDQAAFTDDAGLLAVFSLRNLTWASFAFGGVGTLAVLTQRSLFVTLLSSTLAGVVTLLTVQTIFRYMRRTEAGDLPSDSLVFGTPGELVLPFDVNGLGTVRFVAAGQVREMPARRSAESTDMDSAHFAECRIEAIESGIAIVHPA